MKNLILSIIFLALLSHTQAVHAQQRILVNPAVICAGYPSSFQITAPAVPYTKPVAYYTFLFNNGVSVKTTTPNTARIFPGGYWSVRATVRFTDSSTLAIDSTAFPVYHKPIAGFSLTTPRIQCFGNSFCFKDLSFQNPLQPSNPLNVEIWLYGDGTVDSVPPGLTNICHTYYFPGSFTIYQRVFDTKGCRADTFLISDSSLIVKPDPGVSFLWKGTPQCFGSTYTFVNKSACTLADIKTYTWDFGDSTTYAATAPFTLLQVSLFDSIKHVYTRNGIFSPKLTLTDITGCTYSREYTQLSTPHPFPQNTHIDSTIITYEQANPLINSKLFCAGTGPKQIYFSHTPIHIAQPGSNDFIWDFGDPYSMQLNTNNEHFQPSHAYTFPGKYIVTFTTQNLYPGCNVQITDTITINGPWARIENVPANSIIASSQKYQINSSDTVDFVNNTLAFQNGSLHFNWDFNDEYAPQCTAYSLPDPSFTGRFFDAKQQYTNSTHYYHANGNTFAGKMNCRWSLDSLPRHLYTNWDTVYQWYIKGKNFPANWGVATIFPNAPLTIPSTGIPDPFLQAMGIVANIPQGYTINGPSDALTYFIPGKGTYTHAGTQLLPNSSMTFHEYIFLYSKGHSYHVKLLAKDSAPVAANCSSLDSVIISHGKPDARGMGLAGKICPGASPNGVQFQFAPTQYTTGIKPEFGRTVLLINFDSLADRKDNTPCTLDGFIGYTGGTTNGGLQFPPFSSKPNFNPLPWTDASQPALYYYYGPNAPFGRKGAADSVTGYITIGVIVGTGCANPPMCDQALQYSDTIWYHNILKLEPIKASFSIAQPDALKAKHKTYTYTPAQSVLGDVKYDAWSWDDQTYTVDSFWYASAPVTDNFYKSGFRRVRYQYSLQSGALFLKDSLPFPLGLPRTPGRFYVDTLSREKACGRPDSNYVTLLKDSALMLLPVTHQFSLSSFGKSSDKSNPNINLISRIVGNQNGCVQVYSMQQTIGIINTFTMANSSEQPAQFFCANEDVSVQSFVRYFRYDNQTTELPFNPGRSFNQVYAPPYDTLNYDTINFWQRDIAQTGNIESIKPNPLTGKLDTVYYEKIYWDFGDGSALTKGVNSTHRYTTGGKYTIKMITRDSTGNYDTTFNNVSVSSHNTHIGFPKDQFGKPITIIPCGGTASFMDSSFMTGASGGIDSVMYRYWSFGESPDSTITDVYNNVNPIWTYKSNGSFNIRLETITAEGCRQWDYATVFVKGPRPAFKLLSPVNVCGPAVKIVDQTDVLRPLQPANPKDTPTASVIYYWGDGTATTLNHKLDTLTHNYTTSGTYNIKAVASDAPVGGMNACPLVTYPDTTLGYYHIYTNVTTVYFDSIVGKSGVEQFTVETYQIQETPLASYKWTVNGGTLVSGDYTHSIKAQWHNKGVFSVTGTKSVNGCSHTETLPVSVFLTGLEKTHEGYQFVLYPNPSKGMVNIDFFATDSKEISVNIYDILGKTCFTDQFTPASGNNTKTYNVQKFRPGLYFVEITTPSGKTTQKFQIE